MASARRFLMRYLMPQARAAIPMAAFLLVGTALRVVAPRILSMFIDRAVAGAPLTMLYRIAALFIITSLATQLARVLAGYLSEQVAWAATNALRLDLAAHLLGLDISFHKHRTPGELIERVDGDVAALGGFLSSFAVQLLGSGLLLAGVLVSLWFLNAALGVAFAAFVMVAIAILGQVRRLAGPVIRETRERSAGFYGYLGEVLAATEDIRALGAVPYIRERLLRQLRAWLPVAVRAEVAGNFIWTAAICVFALADALAYGLTGLLHAAKVMPVGTVYMVLAYVALLAEPLETTRAQLQVLQRADAATVRIGQLFATQSRIPDGTLRLPGGALAVQLRDVSFAYDDDTAQPVCDATVGQTVPALQRVSLGLAPGRRLGVLGRTGSGKTTLARLLLRMHDPQAGEASLGGLPLRQIEIASLRQRVGLVTQDVQLFSASLRDNITLFDATVPDVLLTDVLTRLGLGPWLSRLPAGLDTRIAADSLSAGEAQLLALARVFLQDPGLVVLDEAASRLDPATEAMLAGAIEQLLAGRTAIIIAHRLASVETVDDILILADGQVAEYGARAGLLADRDSCLSALMRSGLTEVLS